MSRLRFPYRAERSKVLGWSARPVFPVQFFSTAGRSWLTIKDVLADTGADFSLFPAWVGSCLLEGSDHSPGTRVSGIVPGHFVQVTLHVLKLRIGPREFRALVGIANSNHIPPVVGRYQALDRFAAVYQKGKSLILEW